ncbi:RNA-binding protein [candidate division WOR-3 bacterium]|nr:RNA-binding protein [candidate division WOR-3 bacterium]
MAKRIFVGNLPFSATEDQLRGLFSQHGEVASASIVTDKFTNRSRGFAFVEMSDDAAATAAISALNGYNLDGRPLTVNEARERREGGGGGGRGGFGGDRPRGPRRGGDRKPDYNSRPRW